MGIRYAFMDEYGDSGFNFENQGTSTHFIITAIIVQEDCLKKLEAEVEAVRAKYFGPGEIKSGNVGGNHKRRKMILAEISKIDFSFFALVVDKRKLREESGLGYKQSFYKYLNNRLYTELRKAYPELYMISDQIGTKEFMVGFRKYVLGNTELSLFDFYEFGFNDSKNSNIIQLADFVSGCLAYVYDEKRLSENSKTYNQLLSKKKIRIEFWPPEYSSYVVNSAQDCGEYDKVIERTALRLANEFILKYENRDDVPIKEQVLTLKYLRFKLVESSSKYVTTHELLNYLSYNNGFKINAHFLRTKIIAKLRDEGVIISSSQQGYKLPVRESEIYDFTDHASTVVIPMLERVKKCRDTILISTDGQLDILEMPQYNKLKKYFRD